jgi:hypothetical protein|tara:strand:- start:91 stop:255 length:165 start_codon:yes stop_codon:yes gene_type:complete
MAKKEKKFRQYRSNQGRSPEKMEKVYKGCFWVLLGAMLFVVGYAVCNLAFIYER